MVSYNNPVERRLAILRFLMIAGVVVLHTPLYVPVAEVGSGWFDVTKAFFQNAVFRSTVPVLTCISGYLLFRSGLDRRYGDLLRKKLRTIALPFMVFNLSLVAAVLVVESQVDLQLSYQLFPLDATTLLNAMFGLSASPLNYPLNFLRDLFVLMLLAPLFGWLLRRTGALALLPLAGIFLFNVDGYLILRSEMPVMFYLGGLAAVQNWNLQRCDRHAGLFLAAFVALCLAIVHFKIANNSFLRLVSPLLLWPATHLLAHGFLGRLGHRLAHMSRYSFFIFLAHAPVLVLSWALYRRFGADLPYEVYWLVTPVLTCALLIAIYGAAMRYFPGMFCPMVGASRRRAGVPAMPANFPVAGLGRRA